MARIATLPRPVWRALVPAGALPVIFLHSDYQPRIDVGLGSTTVGIYLSDIAVLAVVVAALLAGVREGWAPLRVGRLLWLLGVPFLALVLAATAYPLLWQEHYRFLTHLVTAAKFCGYALLAPALPLLLRRREDSLPLLWAAAGWSACATGWGLLQFAGLVSEFEGERALQREPSFLGIHDFAALSGAAFALSFAILVFARPAPRERTLGIVAGAAGAIGLVLSGAITGFVGVALAGIAVLGVAARRRQLTTKRASVLIGSSIVVVLGILLIRGGEIRRIVEGLETAPSVERPVESYVHRTLLAYIGIRIFLDHPVLGVGWQGSGELENYEPYLADAHRRFPGVAAVAFPSPKHPWGVQNAYLQTLSDLGILGLIALLALFVVGLVLGLRVSLRAPPGVCTAALAGPLWLLVAAGVWNGLGLVAGIPLEALTWLGFGLVAAALAWTNDART